MTNAAFEQKKIQTMYKKLISANNRDVAAERIQTSDRFDLRHSAAQRPTTTKTKVYAKIVKWH